MREPQARASEGWSLGSSKVRRWAGTQVLIQILKPLSLITVTEMQSSAPGSHRWKIKEHSHLWEQKRRKKMGRIFHLELVS